MSEVYGEREGTYRMTNLVLQSQADWGTIERFEKGKRIKQRKALIVLNNELAVAWLVEAALRYVGKAVSVSTLQSLAVLYPFALGQSVGYVVSQSPILEVRSEEMSNQLIGLRAVD